MSSRPRVASIVLAAALLSLVGVLSSSETEAQPAPTLQLDWDRVVPGGAVRVRGAGYRCASAIQLRLDGVPLRDNVAKQGAFVVDVTIPAATERGLRRLSSWCTPTETTTTTTGANSIEHAVSPERQQAVVPLFVVTPDFTLNPRTGSPGDQALVTGFDNPCTTVTILWDGRLITRVAEQSFQEFEAVITVPDGATAGDHLVAIQCPPPQQVVVTHPFTVVAEPATTSTPTTAPTTVPPTTIPTTIPTTLPPPIVRSDRTEFAAAVTAVDEVPRTWDELFLTFVLAALLVLLIGFPAEIFNSTLEDHYDEIVAPFRRLRFRSRWRPPAGATFVAFAAAAAVLSALVEPGFGFNRNTAAVTIGLFVAFIAITLAFGMPLAKTANRSSVRSMAMRVYPAALLIALACAVLSRTLEFRPGYVYGLVAGFALLSGRTLRPDEEGKGIAGGAVAVLALSVLAWLAWTPVDHYAESHVLSFPLAAVDAVLAAIFVAGVEAMVFQLLPLHSLDGAALRAWSRPVWGLLFGTAIFALVYVLFNTPAEVSDGDRQSPPPVVPMLVLFAAFGIFSFSFWGYFRRRDRRKPRAHPNLTGTDPPPES